MAQLGKVLRRCVVMTAGSEVMAARWIIDIRFLSIRRSGSCGDGIDGCGYDVVTMVWLGKSGEWGHWML